jgi:hypothetical protein
MRQVLELKAMGKKLRAERGTRRDITEVSVRKLDPGGPTPAAV